MEFRPMREENQIIGELGSFYELHNRKTTLKLKIQNVIIL